MFTSNVKVLQWAVGGPRVIMGRRRKRATDADLITQVNGCLRDAQPAPFKANTFFFCAHVVYTIPRLVISPVFRLLKYKLWKVCIEIWPS